MFPLPRIYVTDATPRPDDGQNASAAHHFQFGIHTPAFAQILAYFDSDDLFNSSNFRFVFL